jgi:hypothetical protein
MGEGSAGETYSRRTGLSDLVYVVICADLIGGREILSVTHQCSSIHTPSKA